MKIEQGMWNELMAVCDTFGWMDDEWPDMEDECVVRVMDAYDDMSEDEAIALVSHFIDYAGMGRTSYSEYLENSGN